MAELDSYCVINIDTRVIELNGSKIILRPKTFELLVLLAKAPGKVISKAQILESVWPDSVVEEQVIFQSINEIRKEFDSSEIIKTFPKKGYAWSCPNTTIVSEQFATKPKNSITPIFSFSKSTLVAVTASVTLIIASLYFFFGTPKPVQEVTSLTAENRQEQAFHNASKNHEGVVILPFNVSLLQDSEKWLRYGAMQGVIDQIQPVQGITLFQLEDVIEIVNRLSLDERKDISNIFDKSGASIVLDTKISGVPGDYNIVFSVYTPRSVDTKSLNVKDINEGISLLAQEFNQVTSPVTSINTESMDSKLRDSLIAKAISLLEENNPESALGFLQSALASDKANLYVHYLYSKVALNLGKIDLALESSKSALELNLEGDKAKYHNRLLFVFATASFIQKNYDIAEQTLQKAALESEMSKDWLYFSYTHSMLGKLHQYRSNYDDAKDYFDSALKYQELLKCPMGVAQTNLDLAEFYIVQDKIELAKSSIEISASLIKEHNLIDSKSDLSAIKSKLK
ncbi:winged helix-turn-helix domain-containing protein [Pseudoalteromonas aurantia]|uniref:winged helix-turn-helix domain-containing protein n=1 Tax=Pseudoalteromonas aurantia TaxID=43654 RepID=UPI0014870027|nr:winged helix-turn-helix domain-containing protein [Pseudoalteromonas aurantia]